jgi:hypothetical protein
VNSALSVFPLDHCQEHHLHSWQNAEPKNGDFGAVFRQLRSRADAEREDGSRPQPQQIQGERGTLGCGHAQHGQYLQEFLMSVIFNIFTRHCFKYGVSSSARSKRAVLLWMGMHELKKVENEQNLSVQLVTAP